MFDREGTAKIVVLLMMMALQCREETAGRAAWTGEATGHTLNGVRSRRSERPQATNAAFICGFWRSQQLADV